MADEHPDADAGDVVFVLKQQEHADFKRKGARDMKRSKRRYEKNIYSCC